MEDTTESAELFEVMIKESSQLGDILIYEMADNESGPEESLMVFEPAQFQQSSETLPNESESSFDESLPASGEQLELTSELRTLNPPEENPLAVSASAGDETDLVPLFDSEGGLLTAPELDALRSIHSPSPSAKRSGSLVPAIIIPDTTLISNTPVPPQQETADSDHKKVKEFVAALAMGNHPVSYSEYRALADQDSFLNAVAQETLERPVEDCLRVFDTVGTSPAMFRERLAKAFEALRGQPVLGV